MGSSRGPPRASAARLAVAECVRKQPPTLVSNRSQQDTSTHHGRDNEVAHQLHVGRVHVDGEYAGCGTVE